MLASDVPVDVGTVLDPLPAGMLGVVTVVALVGASGVASEESAGGLSTGELAGEVAGTLAALHWLTGGVFTLQAPGSARARVWLIARPNEDPPPLTNVQRHCGCD